MLLHPLTLLTLTLTLPSLALASPLVAFPGAEGFGAHATGGRAGTSFVVTTLADSGAGSLRDALSQPGRIITFTVGGVIPIKDRLVIPKSTSILGQTAPSPGITIYGNGVSASGADGSIVRYIRVRMGAGGSKGKDALTIAHGHDMLFDHVSASWGRDETFSINGGNAGNISIQDSIIAQGLTPHSAGGLIQTGGGGESQANVRGNYFISGPSSGKTHAFTRGTETFHAYVADNYLDADRDGALNGRLLPAGNSSAYGGMNLVTAPFPYPGPASLLSAKEALEKVLAGAGASRFRDGVDARIVREVRSWGKEGELIESEKEGVMAGLMEKGGVRRRWWSRREAKTWERLMYEAEGRVGREGSEVVKEMEGRAGGAEWRVENPMEIMPSGYTRIEEWAESLLAATTPASKNGRLLPPRSGRRGPGSSKSDRQGKARHVIRPK
ncbi:pectin lyase-like protein [Trichodelitschia bisporula]|uniref:Pectin lyase-like protein n=1 Tax=Trichodelitschia bisporula TaxID=703511 RepID=A0A6G1HSV9_9PEZI|nr:pectin lyase-like protein [Trichodelitschia bisporula]